jgi:cyanophycinase
MTSHIIAVGGGRVTEEITNAALERTGKSNPAIFVCGLASAMPDTASRCADELFRMRHGLSSVFAPEGLSGLCPEDRGWGSLPWPPNEPALVEKKQLLDSDTLLSDLQKSDLVFFCGGDQRTLLTILTGSSFLRQLTSQWHSGHTAIMGTSAGLQVLSEWALTGDAEAGMNASCASGEAVGPGLVQTVPGLGFIAGAVFDQHFIRRKRFGRLFCALADHPLLTGVGVDEDTALIMSGRPGQDAQHIEVIGQAQVFVAQPSSPDASSLQCSFIKAGQNFPFPLQMGLGPKHESAIPSVHKKSRLVETKGTSQAPNTVHQGGTNP